MQQNTKFMQQNTVNRLWKFYGWLALELSSEIYFFVNSFGVPGEVDNGMIVLLQYFRLSLSD